MTKYERAQSQRLIRTMMAAMNTNALLKGKDGVWYELSDKRAWLQSFGFSNSKTSEILRTANVRYPQLRELRVYTLPFRMYEMFDSNDRGRMAMRIVAQLFAGETPEVLDIIDMFSGIPIQLGIKDNEMVSLVASDDDTLVPIDPDECLNKRHRISWLNRCTLDYIRCHVKSWLRQRNNWVLPDGSTDVRILIKGAMAEGFTMQEIVQMINDPAHTAYTSPVPIHHYQIFPDHMEVVVFL